jgi:hypothetical protein
MALSNEAKKDDELPDEVVEEVEAAENGEDGDAGEPQVTLQVSRRKQQQQERDARLAELEARAKAADEYKEKWERTQGEVAQTRAMLELLAQQRQQPAPTTQTESLEDQIKRHNKERVSALAKSDLDAYHEHSDAIHQLQVKQAIASIPQPAQSAFQKPDWVRAVEGQYPDVMTNPNGQRFAAAFETVIPGEFGPDKLHKMFQRARQEIGGGQPVSRAQNAQRQQLFSGVTSTSVRSRPSGGGDSDKVTVPRSYMEMASKAGMTKAQAVKAWKESYPEEK